jgi:hypothetical protein
MTDTNDLPAPTALPAPTLPRTGVLPWRTIGLAASGMLALSAFLPWISVRAGFIEMSRTGLDIGYSGLSDGAIAIALAGAVALAFTLRSVTWTVAAASVVLGGVLVEAGLLVRHMLAFNHETEMGTASLGIGMWLAALAAVVALVAAVKLESAR